MALKSVKTGLLTPKVIGLNPIAGQPFAPTEKLNQDLPGTEPPGMPEGTGNRFYTNVFFEN
jgi:hypothetical protein